MTISEAAEVQKHQDALSAVVAACMDRIQKYPDGPFVVPISEVLNAIGLDLTEIGLAGLSQSK